MSARVYYLIFRRRINSKRKLRWSNPTGGLVLCADRVVDGHPVADMNLVSDLIELRYHAGPHEEVLLYEVFDRKKQRLARRLHDEWEEEELEFLELMSISH